MKTSPRTPHPLVAPLLACALVTPCLCAQERKPRPAPQSPRAAEAKRAPQKTRDAGARARRERQQAVAVLREVAEDARAFEDLDRRASILAFCADALWAADEQASRALFRRAWEAATGADEAGLQDESERAGGGDVPAEVFTQERGGVLKLAAKRDPRLAEVFLREMAESLSAREQGAAGSVGASVEAEAAGRHDVGPWREFGLFGKRLGLASTLLEEGEHQRAAEIAAPAVAEGVSGSLVEFLLRLRAHAPAEADRLYLSLLDRTRADARADANDVLLLSSYALTPRLLAVVDGGGSVQLRPLDTEVYRPGAASPSSEPPSPTPRRVRAAFYDAAAAILLRAAPSNRTGAATDGGGASALYFAIGRLLPSFEREAPRHAPALHARYAALAAEVEAAKREALASQMKLDRLTSDNPTDPLGAQLDALRKLPDAALRDEVLSGVVKTAARRKLWGRAREAAGEIADADKRGAALFVIAARQVANLSEAFDDAEADDIERAAAFVRRAELPPAVRAFGLAQAAELAARRDDRARVAALLDEALGYAEQTETGTAMRSAAMLAAATSAARVGSPRAWEALAAVVRAVNADEDFDGDGVSFEAVDADTPPDAGRETLGDIFGTFTLGELFATMARKDFTRAVGEARTLADDPTRARALVAAARAALEKGGAQGRRRAD